MFISEKRELGVGEEHEICLQTPDRPSCGRQDRLGLWVRTWETQHQWQGSKGGYILAQYKK